MAALLPLSLCWRSTRGMERKLRDFAEVAHTLLRSLIPHGLCRLNEWRRTCAVKHFTEPTPLIERLQPRLKVCRSGRGHLYHGDRTAQLTPMRIEVLKRKKQLCQVTMSRCVGSRTVQRVSRAQVGQYHSHPILTAPHITFSCRRHTFPFVPGM